MTTMNNQNTNDQNSQYQAHDDQVPGTITFIALAIVIGVAIALISAIQQRRKPKTFREKLEYNINKGGEVTSQAFKQLSKEVNDLRHIVEERFEQMR